MSKTAPEQSLGFSRRTLFSRTAQENEFGFIIREKEPLNFEFNFNTLESFITPNERFFIRTHFPIPQLDRKNWRLTVEGAVERPFGLSYSELLRLPTRTVTATLECAGNSRVFLIPAVKGAQWQLGAVGNAEWTGVPLTVVLEQAGIRSDAVEVVLEGADEGEAEAKRRPKGKIHFARSVPLAKVPDVLLAHRMNDEELPVRHGSPLRAIVPGWYAMASVKWLTRIIVSDQPFSGYFQTVDYSYWQRRDELPRITPVTELEVKAEIARPAVGEVIPAGEKYLIQGAAWTGESEITRVEVSTDGAQSWSSANLVGDPVPHAWRLWEFEWRTPERPGDYTLMARASDAKGRVQPMDRDQDRGSYIISHVLPIEVRVQ